MLTKTIARTVFISALCVNSSMTFSQQISVLGGLPIVGSLFALSSLEAGAGSNPVDAVLLNSGVPVLSDLPYIGTLPVIDGRGLPVLGGLDETLRLGRGLITVGLSNNNLSGGIPVLGGDELPLVDLLLDGGPTLSFLALDAIFAQ